MSVRQTQQVIDVRDVYDALGRLGKQSTLLNDDKLKAYPEIISVLLGPGASLVEADLILDARARVLSVVNETVARLDVTGRLVAQIALVLSKDFVGLNVTQRVTRSPISADVFSKSRRAVVQRFADNLVEAFLPDSHSTRLRPRDLSPLAVESLFQLKGAIQDVVIYGTARVRAERIADELPEGFAYDLRALATDSREMQQAFLGIWAASSAIYDLENTYAGQEALDLLGLSSIHWRLGRFVQNKRAFVQFRRMMTVLPDARIDANRARAYIAKRTALSRARTRFRANFPIDSVDIGEKLRLPGLDGQYNFDVSIELDRLSAVLHDLFETEQWTHDRVRGDIDRALSRWTIDLVRTDMTRLGVVQHAIGEVLRSGYGLWYNSAPSIAKTSYRNLGDSSENGGVRFDRDWVELLIQLKRDPPLGD